MKHPSKSKPTIVIPVRPPASVVEALRAFVEAVESRKATETLLLVLAERGKDALNCGHKDNDYLDAKRFQALLKAETIIYPCMPPVSNGRWLARCRGTWGSCGVFGDDLIDLADKLITFWKEHQ
jgi:hypothetical protein